MHKITDVAQAFVLKPLHLLGIFTFYKHQDPQITWHCHKGRGEHDRALTSVNAMATDVHSGEHEADRLVFCVPAQFHARPGGLGFAGGGGSLVAVRAVVDDFSALKEVEFQFLGVRLWARHRHVAADGHADGVEPVWREKGGHGVWGKYADVAVDRIMDVRTLGPKHRRKRKWLLISVIYLHLIPRSKLVISQQLHPHTEFVQ